MDVGELLTFKPESTPKRSSSFDSDTVKEEPKRKQKRIKVDSELHEKHTKHLQLHQNTPNHNELKQINLISKKESKSNIDLDEKLKVLKFLEEENEAEQLDEHVLKKMLLSFEKKVLKNQELRIKFPDNPEKFMESEIDLNDEIQQLHAVATVPDLYTIIVDLSGIQTVLGLLPHENTDISIAVVSLLQELTDVDTLNESEEGAALLIESLLENQICALLVQNLDRLDESILEEADGVHNTLAIIENIVEFKPDICVEFAQQGFLSWLLKRLKAKLPFDANKLYCSEILSILLHNHENNRKLLGELDGIDALLQQLAFYKRHDPITTEEIEFMENLFDCLCCSMLHKSNKERFLKGEGLQLMNLMLREKKLSRNSALKVLNHSMTGQEGAENCNKFVEILGLRTLFPLFMKTPSRHKRKGLGIDEYEEHICSILASMFHNCKGSFRQRILNKFIENDYEKVDRLLELHFKYLEKVRDIDVILDKERRRLEFTEQKISQEQDDEFYMRRLEGGLFTLQLIDYIILEVGTGGASGAKHRITQILNMRGASVKTIRNIMREYASNLGDGWSEDALEQQQQKILNLVDKF